MTMASAIADRASDSRSCGRPAHASAEPATLVVRSGEEEREWLLADAPDTYYLTDYYRPHPVVLARLSHLNRAALRDLLSVSWRLAVGRRAR
jgi:hypothetical protein